MRGGQTISVGGLTSSSSTTVMRSYPVCLVTVYNTGTVVKPALYSDDAGTPLANPFTASATGYWFFYTNDGRYDVTLSGGGIPSPFSLNDITLGAGTNAQIFVNDTNVTVSSTGNTHTMGWAGTLAVPRGGLGVGTLAANGVLLGNGAGAVQATGAGAANQPLRVPGGGGAPTFGALALNQAAAVTGALGIANGGTGAATQTLGFDALSPTTAKGDLIVDNGTNAIRVGVGADGRSLLADSSAATGVAWGLPSLAGLSGTLPLANGGTGQVSKLAAMDGLSPTSTKGDLLVDNGTNVVRQGVGANTQLLIADSTQANGLKWGVPRIVTTTKGDLIVDDGSAAARQGVGANTTVLTADSGQALGVKWALPSFGCPKYTVTFANAAFVAASSTADVTLFTATQFQKLSGVTVKHSVIFSDAGGAMSEVTASLGYAGAPTFYTSPANIGEATPVADTTIYDQPMFRSGTMAAAGQQVLARFTSTGANFGTGAATDLVSGSVYFWVCSTTLP